MADHPDGRHQIGIPAHEHQVVAQVLIGIVQHENGDVDIGSLFLWSLEELCSTICASRYRALDLLVLELSQYHLNGRGSRKGLKVDLLIWLRGTVDHRSEIPDALDVVVGPNQTKEPSKIQPLVRGILNGPIVEVESVYVYDRAWLLR